MAPRDAAPSLPHLQRPTLPLCKSVRTMASTLPILISGLVLPYFDASTLLNGVPVASTIGDGTVAGHQENRKQLGKMPASSAGHLRSDMSESPVIVCLLP